MTEGGCTIPYDRTEGRDLEETGALVEQAGGECLTFTADVDGPRQVEDFMQAAVDRSGRADILSANAGVWAPRLPSPCAPR